MGSHFSPLFILLSLVCTVACTDVSDCGTDWYGSVTENKPYLRWWWHGSAVDKEGLTYNLEAFAGAGIGGCEVTPIYGVQGNEVNDIDYLSPEWMEMYDHLVSESERLGLECDLNNGTGWPFGGPHITPDIAARRMQVDADSIKSVPTGQMVKRAAPGGEGFVMDHYDRNALKVYLDRIDEAFASRGSRWPDTWFNDSYEVYGADWTPAFPGIFRERFGYDIVPYLRQGEDAAGDSLSVTDYDRAVCDYRELLGDLLMENFVRPWTEWGHSHGSRIRNQSHGSPANILDIYGMVDIPECETYGRTEFDIPGLRQDTIIKKNDGDPAVLKFASSAAHLTGRKYVSCEALTWLTEHFRTSLSQCKPELDQVFASGVNHVFFHGAAYTPVGAEFPGWHFYAAIDMSPTGGMWGDAPALFEYIERCQAFLTAGEPDSDFLLYLPVYDAWSLDTANPYMMFDIHGMDRIFPKVKAAMNSIMDMGYDADYISDRQLVNLDISKPVIVPSCRYMPVATARRLVELSRSGVPVYFIDSVPEDVPGLHDLEARRREFIEIAEGFDKPVSLSAALSNAEPEEFRCVERGAMIRRRNECGGHNYFASMLRDHTVNGWVKLAVPAVSAMLFDPMHGTSGKAQLRMTADSCAEIRLQLLPGESVLIKTFPTDIDAPAWNYVSEEGRPIILDSGWSISFPVSDPVIPGSFDTGRPVDWTTLDAEAVRVNWGTACYREEVCIGDLKGAEDWILDLGDVRESARVIVNGHQAGTVWAVPFRISIGEYLMEGDNVIEVHVTNLQSNRIADYDRRGVKWRIFKDANIMSLTDAPDFGGWPVDPSGLCSEVKLIPVRF